MEQKQGFVQAQEVFVAPSQPAMASIVADGSLCGCFDDMESCLLTFFTCMIHPFSTNRERAGVMACLPSAAMMGAFVLINVILSGYSQIYLSHPYSVCTEQRVNPYLQTDQNLLDCVRNNIIGWQGDDCNPCKAEYDAMWSGMANVQGVYFVIAVCLCAMLGNNRSKLQLALGMPDAGCINYVLYAPIIAGFCSTCAQCQESRAVKARWLANGQQPLGGIQVPMQPTAPAGQFVQAPQ